MWPNFYVVGAAKCGTTSVWAYLKKHPEVFLPEIKEPSFFTKELPRPGLEDFVCTGNEEKYHRLYRRAKGYRAIGDSSALYLWDPVSPGWIRDVCPHARIVILLRDPVERAYSHYWMIARAEKNVPPFFEAIQLDSLGTVGGGLYFAQVRRYLETFGREQVGIFLFENLKKDPQGIMSAICSHIGVDPALLDVRKNARVHNAGQAPRVKWLYNAARAALSPRLRLRILPPSVHEWIRSSTLLYKRYKPPKDERASRYLQDIYEPDLCSLEELLGRKLPELRKSWV